MKSKSYVLIDPDCTPLVERLRSLFQGDSTLIACSTTPVEGGAYLLVTPEGDGDGGRFGGTLRLPYGAVLMILDPADDSALGFQSLIRPEHSSS